jgi:PAS domain S-box-containing protein
MKTKISKITWILGISILVWWGTAWNLAQYRYLSDGEEYLLQKKQLSQERVQDLSSSIERNLGYLSGIPELHSNLARVSKAAARFGSAPSPSTLPYEERKARWTNDTEFNELSRLLAIAETSLHADMIYVINAAGDCFAASNWYKKGSPIGTNFAERDYFRKNLLGQNGMQYAVGKTTRIPGLYFSSPVYANGIVIGAVVAKIDIPNLAFLTKQLDGFVTDKHGVIVLSHNKSLEMKALSGSSVLRLSDAERLQRYLQTELPTAAIQPWSHHDFAGLQRIGENPSPYWIASRDLPELGLTAYVTEELPLLTVLKNERNLFAVLYGLLGSCLILLLGGGYHYLRSLRHARDTAQKSEARLKLSQHIAGLGSWELDVVRNTLDWSDEVYKIFEIDKEHFVASYENFLHAIHPDDRESVNAAYRQHLTDRSPYEITHRLLMPDGRIKYVTEQCWSEFDHTGQPLRSVGTVQDVTTRKSIEEALRASEAQYRELVYNANVIILRLSLDGTVTYFNEFAERFFGYSSAEILGKPVVGTIVPPRESETDRDLDDLIQHILSSPENYAENENENLTKDGKRAYIHWTNRLILDANGHHSGILSIGHDITARQQLEKMQSASHARLTSILSGFPGAVLVEDEKRHITLVNKTFCDLFSIPAPPEALVGMDCADSAEKSKGLFSDPEQFIHSVGSALSEGKPRLGEILPMKDGRILSRDYLPILSDTKFIGNLWMYRDVTQQQQIESAMRQAKEMAEHTAQTKSEFLANMSHEIRTPMNGIIGLTELALNQPVNPDVRDYLDKIASTSQSLLAILNDILDFSKLEAGRMSIDSAPFHLDDILDNLRSMFAERAHAKKLECVLNMGENLPHHLVGDALRLQQILANLIGNAIKFTDHGQVALDVKLVDRSERSARLSFTVSDTGIGISPSSLEKLFRPFSQVDGSITRRFGGTGLGLAISQNLLKLMGGKFNVTSQVGSGTAFSFELDFQIAENPLQPRKTAARLTLQAGELGSKLSEIAHSMSGARILVAEDNAINQQVVCGFLRLSGIHVDVANNGAEALAHLADHQYDGILMDVHMPVMGGVETTRTIRANPQHAALPIIALSAGVTKEERENCLASGMNDFIAKPIVPDELIRTLAIWIHPSAPSTQTAQPTRSANASQEQHAQDSLAGFDLQNLRILLNDDQTLLSQLLNQFRADIAGIPEELGQLLEEQEIASAERVMHRLKGLAGNLGATELYNVSAEFDDQLKQGRYTPELLQHWSDTLQRTLRDLAHFLERPSLEQTVPESAETLANLHELHELERLLQGHLYIDDALLQSIQSRLAGLHLNYFEDVVQNIKNIDYAGAQNRLRMLLTELEGKKDERA